MVLNPFSARVLWPIRCGLCQQWHLLLRDYPCSKVLGGFYRVSIIFRLERGRVSEFSASPRVSVVRQSGNKSQVSAAGPCSLLRARSSGFPGIRMWAISACNPVSSSHLSCSTVTLLMPFSHSLTRESLGLFHYNKLIVKNS